MMEEILAQEEEHAEDMSTLLEELGKKGEPARPRPGGAGAKKATRKTAARKTTRKSTKKSS